MYPHTVFVDIVLGSTVLHTLAQGWLLLAIVLMPNSRLYCGSSGIVWGSEVVEGDRVEKVDKD